MFLSKKRLRPLFLSFLGVAIIAEIVVLTPSSLEELQLSNAPVDPETLIENNEPTLAPGIPKKRIPEYSIEKFRYVSVKNEEKLWKIDADRAFLYSPERLVHSRVVTAYLYDPDGKVTLVTGAEAKYFMNQKDLEIFGNVKTTFPDGFQLKSEYLRYLPQKRQIKIPSPYLTHGIGQENAGQKLSFISTGLDYIMEKSLIHLEHSVKVTLENTSTDMKVPSAKSPTLKVNPAPGVPDQTTIESDHCVINRQTHLAKFTMSPVRPLTSRFVHITQPTLFARGRRADLNYGNFSQVLQYLTAYEDVLIKETGSKNLNLRYATSGRADFDTRQDVIVLTQYPQVYQDQDTVIGDTILLHRDSDVIEVEHSNAFSQGQSSP